MIGKQKKLVLGLTVFSALLFLAIDPITNNFPSVMIDAAKQINVRPVGEIVKGFKIQQVIPVECFDVERNTFSHNLIKDVYLEILLANYSNRKNRGTIQVSIEQGKLKTIQNIDMSKVEDNSFHRVCFPVEEFAEFSLKNNLVLKITGLNGKSGSSVTAWLTEDISKGVAGINGVKTDKSLVYGLLFKENAKSISYSALALFLTYMSLLLLLIGILRTSRFIN